MRLAIATLAASALVAGAALDHARSTGPTTMTATAAALDRSGIHDFDFLAGEWRIHHRRLKERLAGSTEWIEFSGTQKAQLLMNGAANMDDNFMDMPGGAYRAVTLRAFDPKTGLWSIWWLDGRNPHGPLDPPMRGRFENGVGLFFADDTFNGKPIRVRFIWSNITKTTARWEQAFSPDAGKTWETNWVMDFARVA
jgi:hypothetical protein